jgi:dienelactone hydrolase
MEEVRKILETLPAPEVRSRPELDTDREEFRGIRAIDYDGLPYKGKKTSVFAYLGVPKGASPDAPVPGVVLVHGGYGHPYLPWVKKWNDRGFAAIAMETTGAQPLGRNAGDWRVGPQFSRGVPLPEGYVPAPDNDEMLNDEAPLEEQWMTHALSQVWLANGILRAQPGVDAGRVGICGISWGGVITSLSLALDPRYAFAVPIYGSGYLDRALSYIGPKWHRPGNIRHFRAEDGFAAVRMPVLWLAANVDENFSPQSHSASYEATAGGDPLTSLCWIDKMPHGHVAGWTPEIQYLFADAAVNGGEPLAHFETQPDEERAEAKLIVPPATRVTGARIFTIDEPMSFAPPPDDPNGTPRMRQTFAVHGASYAGGVVSAAIPRGTRGYYVEVFFENAAGRPYSLCSRWVERDG